MDFCLCKGRKKFVEQKKCVWSSEFSHFILPFSSLFDASDKYNTDRAGLIHTCMCKSVVLDLYQTDPKGDELQESNRSQFESDL